MAQLALYTELPCGCKQIITDFKDNGGIIIPCRTHKDDLPCFPVIALSSKLDMVSQTHADLMD